MIPIFFLIFGLLVGSFANVCIQRLPRNKEIFFTRSACPHCNQQIEWFFNIPVFSYLYLAGHANCCGKKIDKQYPIIELLTGLLFLINYLMFNISQSITLSIIFFIVLLIIVIDFKERVIFDFMNYFLIISGIIVSIINPDLNPLNIKFLNAVITGLIGFGLFYALRYLFKKKRDIEALGMGDVYLIAGLGVWLGFEKFLYILSISSFLGIFYYLLYGKNKDNFEIPYGSALGISFIFIFYLSKIF